MIYEESCFGLRFGGTGRIIGSGSEFNSHIRSNEPQVYQMVPFIRLCSARKRVTCSSNPNVGRSAAVAITATTSSGFRPQDSGLIQNIITINYSVGSPLRCGPRLTSSKALKSRAERPTPVIVLFLYLTTLLFTLYFLH